VREVRAAPGTRSDLHRHIHPVIAFTKSGAWGHRPERAEYTSGSYVYEPVGAVHCFHNGPGLTEAVFVQLGEVEWLTEDGRDVLRRETPRDVVNAYLAGCEAAGLARPNIVS
jgi:quercetin dioxygenase-like cupin family protein